MIIVGGWSRYRSRNNGFKELETYEIIREDLETSLTISGTTKSQSQVALAFETSGKVTHLAVKEGDQVVQGQYLGQVNTTTLQNSLDTAKVTLDKFESVYTELVETYKVETQTIPIQEDTKQAQKNVEIYRLAYEAAKFALNKASLYSPINGVVTNLNIQVGEYVIAGTTKVATVANLDDIIFEIEIAEEDLGKLQSTHLVTVDLDAYPQQEHAGQVFSIGSEARENAAGETVVVAKIKITDDRRLPKIGLSGDARFTLNQVAEAMVIPFEALIPVDEVDYVFVRDQNGSVAPRQVTTGFETDDMLEVVDGLSEGETVLLDVPEKAAAKEVAKLRRRAS